MTLAKDILMPTETTWGEGQCWVWPLVDSPPSPWVEATTAAWRPPTWISGHLKSRWVELVVPLGVRPSVMTRAMRLFWVGGSSSSGVGPRHGSLQLLDGPAGPTGFMGWEPGLGGQGLRCSLGRGPGSGVRRQAALPPGVLGIPDVGAVPQVHVPCIWLWLYCTTPACTDCPGSNLRKAATMRSTLRDPRECWVLLR